MLKKILLTLLVLFLLTSAGLAVFIFTFDAERYRPYFTQKISEATGAEAHLEKISLRWRGGFALEAGDFSLTSKGARAGESAPLEVKSAAVAVEALPLLRGQLQMGALLLDGLKVRIDRGPDGALGGAAALFENAGKSGAKKPGAESFMAFLISRLQVQNGEFIFRDASSGASREYRFDRIDFDLQNVSFLRPFPVRLKTSFLSRRQNIRIQGRVHVQDAGKKISLEDFNLETDLAELDPGMLVGIAPGLQENWLPEFSGHLSAALTDLVLEKDGPAELQLKVRLTDGHYADKDSALSLENVRSEALVKTQGMELQSFSAELGGGHLAGSGHLDWKQTANLLGDFQIVLSGAELARLVPSSDPQKPRPEGTLAADFKGTFAGSDPRVLSQTLAGSGRISIKGGVIRNLNVTREMIGKLSIIPGLSEKMAARLSEDYQQKLKQDDTYFAALDIPLRASAGVIYADSVSIASETFLVNGGGQAVLNGPVSGRFVAALDPEFSSALMKSVRELQYIADRQGQIVIPFTVRGPSAHPELFPDLQDLASRLAVGKTQELISGMLTKKNTGEPQDPSALETQDQETQQPADPLAALLGQVLAGKKQ